MSTILKALRRLEKEREVEAPDLRDQVLADAPPQDARPRFPLLVGAGAIGAVLVVGGFTFLDGRFDSKEDATAVAAPEATVPPESSTPPAEVVRPAPTFQEPTRATRPSRPRREPAPPPRATQPAPPVEPPVLAAASRRASAASRRAASAPSPAASHRAASAVARAKEIPSRTPAPAPVAAPPPTVQPASTVTPPTQGPEPTPAATAAPVPAVTATVDPAPAAPPDPGVVEAVERIAGIMGQPEVARRSPLPSLVVERTLWHPRSERRLAFLKVEGRTGMVELREGDAVGDAVVQQIDPSAVVFLHRGVEIRRRIGAGE